MATMSDATIDLVVTSPPYNLGIAYSRYSDRQDRSELSRLVPYNGPPNCGGC